MLNLQKLRHLSCICAYCNKVIPMHERTNDHLIPRCAGGETEIQNIEYKINLSGKNFYINELKAKILDYYLQNPNFFDYKNFAQELGIGKNRLIKEISKNGIVLNNLWCENLECEIIKSESEVSNEWC